MDIIEQKLHKGDIYIAKSQIVVYQQKPHVRPIVPGYTVIKRSFYIFHLFLFLFHLLHSLNLFPLFWHYFSRFITRISVRILIPPSGILASLSPEFAVLAVSTSETRWSSLSLSL